MQGSLPTDKDWFPTTGTATSSAGIWRGVTESEYFVQDESSVYCEELLDEDIATFWHEVDMSAHGASSSSTPKQGTQVFCLADDDEEPHEESASSSMKSNTPLWHFPWWKVDASENQRCDENYLVRTRMKDKQGEALLVDPGSPENLCGDEWSHRQQLAAQAAGRPTATYTELSRTLTVGGVGTGTQSATHAVRVHLGMPGGKEGTYEAPELPNSSTPALLGQKSLKRFRSLIDCYNKQLFHIGPGGYHLQLSPGSVQYQLEESHAGHLMLPCSEFEGAPKEPTAEMLTAVQETKSMPRCGPTAVYSGRGTIGAAETTVTRTSSSSPSTEQKQLDEAAQEGAARGTRY